MDGVGGENNCVDEDLKRSLKDEDQFITLPKLDHIDYNKLGQSGLSNLGNTCYLNAALQCLSHTIPLTDYLVRGHYRQLLKKTIDTPATDIFAYYTALIVALWSDNCIIVAKSFLKTFGDYFPNWIPYSQNDAEETIIFLLDQLHNALSYSVHPDHHMFNQTNLTFPRISKQRTVNYCSNKAQFHWHQEYKNKNSIILDIFAGQEHHRLQCTYCSRTRHTFPPFKNIELSLNITNYGNPIQIEDLIGLYYAKDQLDHENKWKCDRCEQPTRAYQKTTIWRCPKVLIITLKRFINNQYVSHKNNIMIEYPLRGLDLEEHVTGGIDTRSPWDDHNRQKYSTMYDLYAICCHQVISATCGHYYSYCLNTDGCWYLFDDDVVNSVSIDDLITKDAYVLFYRQRN